MEGIAASIEILPLTPDRFADLAALFEQGGDPKWCWCTSFRRTGTEWRGSTPDQNRALLRDLAGHDPAPGLVAYRDGAAIGWVSLAPREDYARLGASKVLAPIDERPVWSIVCFVVSRRARGQGVATVLLDAAIAYARDHGATMLEAYPEDTDASGTLSAAVIYKGTVSMFERAGFDVVARRQWNAATRVRPIVRKDLERGRRESRRAERLRGQVRPVPERHRGRCCIRGPYGRSNVADAVGSTGSAVGRVVARNE